jgi:hypothetical protein
MKKQDNKFQDWSDEETDTPTRKATPFIQFFAMPGCQIVRTWEESFEDRVGNQGVVTKCEYTDKKGKLHEFVRYVRWIRLVEARQYH